MRMKRLSDLCLAAACAAVLAGCSTTLVREDPRTIRLGDSGVACATTPLVKELLAIRGTSVHAVQGSWKDHVFSAESVTKGEDGRFTAIFLAPHMRLATITLTPPHTITFDRARRIPSAFEPEYALFDLAVVNLPADRLRLALGASFTVSEADDRRTISAAGRPIAVRTALPDGTVRYENLPLGYAYVLKEVR